MDRAPFALSALNKGTAHEAVSWKGNNLFHALSSMVLLISQEPGAGCCYRTIKDQIPLKPKP